jgi:hypothetical protein
MSVVMLLDSPNISKSVSKVYGQQARPDFKQLHKAATEFGPITKACALVNDGVSLYLKDKLIRSGFEVYLSHADDCDDALFAWAVRLHTECTTVVFCSGDGGFHPLVTLFQRLHVRVVVWAVTETCSRRLRAAADVYQEMPVKFVGQHNTAPLSPSRLSKSGNLMASTQAAQHHPLPILPLYQPISNIAAKTA